VRTGTGTMWARSAPAGDPAIMAALGNVALAPSRKMTFPTVAAGATAAGTFGTPGPAMTSPQIATTFRPR
jgi:hypothetical protein